MQERMRGDAFLENAMEKHGDAVYRLALCRLGSRADAEDVYQDVFLRLLRDSTEFRDSEHLKAWLLRVTLRCRTSCARWCGCSMSRAAERMRLHKSYTAARRPCGQGCTAHGQS